MSFDAVPEEFKLPYTWLDGELVKSEQALISPMTYTLHYGLGVFEGIRAYNGEDGPAVLRLEEHIARLFRSARLVRMEIPFTEEAVCQGCIDALSSNGLPEGYIRPIAFVDDGKRGLSAMRNRVRVAITVWPWGAYLGEEGMKNGIKCCVSSWFRMSPKSLVPKGKVCGQYVNSILAKRDANLGGYDEAILLDEDGYVAEATGENLFAVRNGCLWTAPVSAPILEGITRAGIIEIAQKEGIEVIGRRFARDFLYGADEVFLTGTAAEVTPVRSIDNRPMGEGGRGPITEKIQKIYLDAVRGRDDRFTHWLTRYRTQ